MKKYTGKEFFVNTKQCETQKFPWGTLQWTIEPRTTGTDNMTGGIVTLLPGLGHSQHSHECDEILYMIDGKDCEQYIILEDGTRISEFVFCFLTKSKEITIIKKTYIYTSKYDII